MRARAELGHVFQQLDPAGAGQRQVEKDHIGAGGGERALEILGAVGGDDLVTDAERDIAQEIADLGLVVDDQHPHGHQPFPPSFAALASALLSMRARSVRRYGSPMKCARKP